MGPRTALLIVDAQVAILDDDPPPFNRESVIDSLKMVLGRARASETPVLFVQHIEDAYPPMTPGHPGFETHPDIAPMPGEPVVHKRSSDSFYNTDLAERLHDLGIERLIVGGMQTELCIDSTVRSATSHGFDVVLIGDGHSTWDSSLLSARQIIDHHNATLPNVAYEARTVEVTSAAEVAFPIDQWSN